jgi:hypothetical protein
LDQKTAFFTGFAASKIAQYNTKGTIVLTASGALIGAALSALLHKDPPVPIPDLNENPPPLKDAETDIFWVPDSISDGKFIEGHRTWTIRTPAHWLNYPAIQEEKEEKHEDRDSKKE